MKQVLKAAGGLLILAHIAIGILIVTIIGCGEGEDPLKPEAATAELTGGTATVVGTIGEMKALPDAAPSAPSAPTDGTPYVKSVRYYSNWQLTEEIDHEEPVPVGTLLYIHIVFSEPVRHRITDNPEKDAPLPVLFHWVNGGITRFRIMQHGASGEDFTSGDAKPKGGGTDDFICKYRVRKKDQGSQFWIRIGRWSVDLEWNKMKDHYVHETRLRLGEPEPEEPVKEEPKAIANTHAEIEPEVDTTPPIVVSITHYNDRTGEVIADGASVPAGTTINTEVVFSEPVKPKITYTTGGKERPYTLSPRGGLHWRGLCKPTDENETTWLCRQNALGDSFSVTVTTDTTDRAGNQLAELVTTTVMVGAGVIQPTVPQTPTDTRPTVPDQPTPEPVIPQRPVQQLKEFVDLGYTFTVEGETYPGFNPSLNLQRILVTHPSAKLPHFEEAVQMVEVINWAHQKSYDLRHNGTIDTKTMEDIRIAVRHQFGYPGNFNDVTKLEFDMALLYFYPDATHVPDKFPRHSRYWFHVEFLRLRLQYPGESIKETMKRWTQSAKMGHIVGTTNPNS